MAKASRSSDVPLLPARPFRVATTAHRKPLCACLLVIHASFCSDVLYWDHRLRSADMGGPCFKASRVSDGARIAGYGRNRFGIRCARRRRSVRALEVMSRSGQRALRQGQQRDAEGGITLPLSVTNHGGRRRGRRPAVTAVRLSGSAGARCPSGKAGSRRDAA
jgi:hypothetical protein